MKKIKSMFILLSCVLCCALMFACSKQIEEDDGMKTYISFQNTSPGSWEGDKSESTSMIPIIDEDGSNVRYLDLDKLDIEEQNTWAACGAIVIDGKNKMVISSSDGGMGFLASTRKNIWVYDIETEEILKLYDVEDRPDYIEFARQLDNERIIIMERYENVDNTFFSIDLYGNDKKDIIFDIPDGYLYSPQITPDGKYFIIQHSNPYSLWKCDIEGGECDLLAIDPNGLCFNSAVSNDSKWLAYTNFDPRKDPLHEWADIYMVNIETKEKVQLIDDKSYWLTAYHGDETIRGGGSNILYFAPFGDYVTVVKGLENSKSPWKKDTSDNPDNHFNCVYDESIASGGTGISLLDIYTGEEIVITEAVEGNWDFRPRWNTETHKLLFVRAKTGEKSELWMCDKDGSNQKLITKGYNDVGVDFPMWIQ